jgi:hypothetical protein
MNFVKDKDSLLRAGSAGPTEGGRQLSRTTDCALHAPHAILSQQTARRRKTPLNYRSFAPVLSPNSAVNEILHCRFFPQSSHFDHAINVLLTSCPACMTLAVIFGACGLQTVSVRFRFLLVCRHINKGGTCRGPCLETECARCVRRIRLRWRDLAGSILSSRGRRRRQTKQLPV